MALSSSDLTQIRADVASLLPDTGSILSSSLASDGAGGWTTTWGTASSGVSYRLDPIRQREETGGGRLDDYHNFQLTLPWNTTIAAENKFQASDGQLYNVIGVDDGKSWQVSVRCIVERA